MRRIVGEALLDSAGAMAFPRRAGSSGSRRIVKVLADRLLALGFNTEIEDFSYDLGPVERVLQWTLAIGGCLILFAGALLDRSPWWSLALTTFIIVAGGAVLGWSPWLERLYCRPGPTRTANVVGRRQEGEIRRRLILMAHHDSKSQSLGLPERLGATIGAMAGIFVITAVAGVEIAGWWDGARWFGPLTGVIGGGSMIALATMTSGNASPGGVDNGGSLAMILEIAGRMRSIPSDFELVVLFTGAEEDHMVGAMRWLDRHEDDLVRTATYCLNFDGAGSPGRTVLITRYGLGRRLAPTLERVAVDVSHDLGHRVRRIIMAPAVGIDAIPFAHRGIECLTISSGSIGRATSAVHSAGDTADNLHGPTMAGIADYATAMIERLMVEWGYDPQFQSTK